MRIIQIENPGTNSRLIWTEIEPPTCGPEELLVEVKATALNRADLLQRQGKYPPPVGASPIPGLEIAGKVVAVGAKVSRFKPGDRVYGLVNGGAYAEYCCLAECLAAPIPEGWDYALAAAIPEALMTVHATVFSIGQLKAGQTLLIHAAGSGIASLAIQMAKHNKSLVITTASNEEKRQKAKELGANQVINYTEEDFARAITKPIDLIVDFLGGPYFAKHLTLLNSQGKLVQIACMQGHRVDCDLALLMRKRIQIHGFVLRSQSLQEKAQIWQAAQARWSQPLIAKEIQPIIDTEFEFDQMEEAHTRLNNSAHFGKIVICFP